MAETFTFRFSNRLDFDFFHREGEEKWNERWTFGEKVNDPDVLVLGVSEDHGPQANFGSAGASAGYKNCIARWGNMVFHDKMPQQSIHILGNIQQNRSFEQEDKNGKSIEELDDLVLSVLDHFQQSARIILIGGGHNNALPIIRHFKKRLGSVHSVNIDPHADCRSTVSRHSGNPFSFALQEGSLDSYLPIGLHLPYNNAFIQDFLARRAISPLYFETALDNYGQFMQELESSLALLPDEIGLDIDLDSIVNMPCSAATPSGFQLDQIRQILRKIAKTKRLIWLHLPEGAPTNESEMTFYSKSVAYLIFDYLLSANSSQNV